MLPVTATLAERHTGEKEIKQEVRVGSGPRIASPDSTTAFKETATRSRFTTDRLLRQFRDQFEEFFFASYFQLSTPSRKCFLHLWVQMSRMRLSQHFCSDSPAEGVRCHGAAEEDLVTGVLTQRLYPTSGVIAVAPHPAARPVTSSFLLSRWSLSAACSSSRSAAAPGMLDGRCSWRHSFSLRWKGWLEVGWQSALVCHQAALGETVKLSC